MDIKDKVKNVIDKIRPILQEEGGDIELIEVTEDNVVKVKLLGACGGCPYRIMTLKNGVELAIKEELPEIKEVINIE